MPEPQLDARGRPRAQYQTINDGPELTVQSDAGQADIKQILKRWKNVGIVDHLAITEASFKDVSEFSDYADVMRTAQTANEEFMKMPSKVREIFGHDVANWLDTAHDPEKLSQLIAEGKVGPDQEPAVPPPPAGDGGNDEPGNPGPSNP